MTRISEPQRLPDWLLGGRVRRRILERLAGDAGWTARELAEDINASQPVVYETFRALKAGTVDALEATGEAGEGRYRLRNGNAVADALRKLLAAVEPLRDEPVSRPPSRSH